MNGDDKSFAALFLAAAGTIAEGAGLVVLKLADTFPTLGLVDPQNFSAAKGWEGVVVGGLLLAGAGACFVSRCQDIGIKKAFSEVSGMAADCKELVVEAVRDFKNPKVPHIDTSRFDHKFGEARKQKDDFTL